MRRAMRIINHMLHGMRMFVHMLRMALARRHGQRGKALYGRAQKNQHSNIMT